VSTFPVDAKYDGDDDEKVYGITDCDALDSEDNILVMGQTNVQRAFHATLSPHTKQQNGLHNLCVRESSTRPASGSRPTSPSAPCATAPCAQSVHEYVGVHTKDVVVLKGSFTKSFGGMRVYISANQRTIDPFRTSCAGSLYHNSLGGRHGRGS
jgi:hypothetical protein